MDGRGSSEQIDPARAGRLEVAFIGTATTLLRRLTEPAMESARARSAWREG